MTQRLNPLHAENVLYGRNGFIYLQKEEFDAQADLDTLVGNNVPLFSARNITARFNVASENVSMMGEQVDRPRRMSWNGNGDLRIYRVGTHFQNTALEMTDLRVPVPRFVLQMETVNADPDVRTRYGEIIVLKQVKFWQFDWMMDSQQLTDLPLTFTFEGRDFLTREKYDETRSLFDSVGDDIPTNYNDDRIYAEL